MESQMNEYQKTKDLYDLAWEGLLAQVAHIAIRSRTNPRTAFWLRKLQEHAEALYSILAQKALDGDEETNRLCSFCKGTGVDPHNRDMPGLTKMCRHCGGARRVRMEKVKSKFVYCPMQFGGYYYKIDTEDGYRVVESHVHGSCVSHPLPTFSIGEINQNRQIHGRDPISATGKIPDEAPSALSKEKP